jgi:acetyltransferase-like isoleucine patch superfamily enzyme
VRQLATLLLLKLIQAWDRARLRRLARAHPGLEIHPDASTNLAFAGFSLAPGARLRIGPGVVAERRREGVSFHLGEGAEMEIGAGSWLHSEVAPVRLRAFPGGRITVGPDAFLNGCHLSAKQGLTLGRGVWVGPGTRVFDSDQHALDLDTPECTQPVRIGDYCWVSSDVTVLRGVEIGAHCVIGTRSLVNRSIPEHSLAFGSPATPRGRVGDRSKVPI